MTLGHVTKKAEKELRELPGVTGHDFAILAEAFREFVNAQQENVDDVIEVLQDRGWERDECKFILGCFRDGVGFIYDSATDPLAEAFKKDTATKVGRKSG